GFGFGSRHDDVRTKPRQTCDSRASVPAHQCIKPDGEVSLIIARKFLVQLLCNCDAEHAVAEEFKPLVGYWSCTGMCQCQDQQLRIRKMMPNALLERGEALWFSG